MKPLKLSLNSFKTLNSFKKLTITVVTASVLTTGCASTNGYGTIAQNAVLGAAAAAATQAGGNSHDIKNAAGIGALLGILGGAF